MKTILKAIYHCAFFKSYTDMPRWMEAGYGVLFWIYIAVIIFGFISCTPIPMPVRDNYKIVNTEYRQLRREIKGEIYSFIQFNDSGTWRYIPQEWAYVKGDYMSKKECPGSIKSQAGWIYDYENFNDNYLDFVKKYPDIEYYFLKLKILYKKLMI